MRYFQIQLTLANNWNFYLSRRNDAFLMDIFRYSGDFSDADLRNLNAVRMYLQVATISDIASADGRQVTTEAYRAQKSTERQSKWNWIRQPVITTKQQKLWAHAVRKHLTMSSSTQSPLVLRTRLGPWIAPPNQTWSYYYNSNQEVLYTVITPTQVSQHMRVATQQRKRHTMSFARESESTTFNISNMLNHAPADIFSSASASQTTLQACASIWELPTRQPKDWYNIQTYKSALLSARQRLLVWSNLRKSFTQKTLASLMATLTTNPVIESGSDGSLQDRKGTFGYAISIAGQIFWEGAGPADGDASTANSKRPELYGYAGCLEACLMLTQLSSFLGYSMPQTVTLLTWIDNDSGMRHLNRMLSRLPGKCQYPHDADILAHITWLWTQFPTWKFEVKWVKAHQDDNRAFADLPHNAQLNVVADQMAAKYYTTVRSSAPKPRTQPLSFPANAVAVTVNGQRIMAKYKEVLRFHINGTRLRTFLQSTKPGWKSDRVWLTIDMAGLGMTFRTLDTTKRLQVSKTIY
jgi:hypothetical protein